MNVQLRQLTSNDLPFCNKLINQAGWNQTDKDWQRIMLLNPEGCFIARLNGTNVGTIAYTIFSQNPENMCSPVAWISMVLVDKKFRGQGIGQVMFSMVMRKLSDMEVGTVRLDATPMGLKIYSKFGFEKEYELIRLIRDAAYPERSVSSLPKTGCDPIQLAWLDGKYTGTYRYPLIQALADELLTGIMHQRGEKDTVSGYVAWRPGRTAWQIGPCIAEDPEQGNQLLGKALEQLSGQRVIIDIPVVCTSTIRWALDNHFVEQRRFVRMFFGRKIKDNPGHILASFGPEKG